MLGSSHTPLTSEDFIRLKENPRHYSRVAIAEKISSHIQQSDLFSNEHMLACEIAFFLQRDEHESVREALAIGLAPSYTAPKELIMLLANDNSNNVALPILHQSPLLEDQDLINIAALTNDAPRLYAIAERDSVSATVTTLLVKKDIEKLTLILLENKGAGFSKDGVTHIAEQHRGSRIIVNRLKERMPQLVPDIEKILQKAAPTQTNKTVSEMPSFVAISNDSLGDNIFKLLGMGANPPFSHAQSLAVRMHADMQVNAAIMLSALNLGHLSFFYAAFAQHTHLPASEVQKLCETSQLSRVKLFNRARLSPSLHPLMDWQMDKAYENIRKDITPNSLEFLKAMKRSIIQADAKGINFAKTVGFSLIKVTEHCLKK